METQKINAVIRSYVGKIGFEVMVISDDSKLLNDYIDDMKRTSPTGTSFHIQRGIRMMLSEHKKSHKGIICGHEHSETYSCVEGTTFYGDLCEDCMDKFEDLLIFENDNPGEHISDIIIRHKYDDWDIFSRIIKK